MAFPEDVIRKLKSLLGETRCSTSPSVLHLHSHDESYHKEHNPDVVVFPKTRDEIIAIVTIAKENKVPVTCWGAGSSLEGNPIPVKGGIVLSTAQMNTIVKITPEDFQIEVEPGVIYKEMNKRLRKYGLFFPPDPGASATIGGMIANNAKGVQSVKYGSTKNYILDMEVVLASGECITLGSKALKSSCGYNLMDLFVGSEGTLGIVTKATLKLAGLPEHFMAATVAFNKIEETATTVYEIISSGLLPSALELLDSETIEALNDFTDTTLKVLPTLFIEFQGISKASLQEELELLTSICEDNNCVSFESGFGEASRNKLWETRHKTYEFLKMKHKGQAPLLLDVAVPISQYPGIVEFAKKTAKKHNIDGYLFSHAGDGNIHFALFPDRNDKDSRKKAEYINDEVVEHALALGGTATGEHGVGLGKRKFLEKEHHSSLYLMKEIKKLLDPDNIFNPGKIFL